MKKKWLMIGTAVLLVAGVASTAIVAAGQGGIDGAGDPALGFGQRGFRFGGDLLTILAEQLSMEQSELVTEIQAGKTIAQLAEENSVDTAAIVDAIVAAQQETLTAAVEAGRLTQAQADARLELARANAEALLDQPLNAGGFGLRGDGLGGRGHFGSGGFDDRRGGFPGGHGGWGDVSVPPAAQSEATSTPDV